MPDAKDKEALPANTTPAPVAAHGHADPPIGLRTVAMFEFGKGILFLLLGLGLFSFVHHDVAKAAEDIIHYLHLDPAWHYSKMFVQQVSTFKDSQFRLYGILAFALAAVRVVEGYCLWHERPWAEWFAIISSGSYMPLEIYHYQKHPDVLLAVIFAVNLAIVIYLAWLLVGNHRKRAVKIPPAKP